jgi:hypothetical protein
MLLERNANFKTDRNNKNEKFYNDKPMITNFKTILDLHEKFLLRKIQTTNYYDCNDPKILRNYYDVISLDETNNK